MTDFGAPPPPPEYVYEAFRPKLSDPLRTQPTQFVPPSRDPREATMDYYRGLEDQAAASSTTSSVRDRFSFGTNASTPGRQLGSFAMLKYLSLAAMSPFEVAATLVQIQWLPSDAALYQLQQQERARLLISSDEEQYDDDEDEDARLSDRSDLYLSDRTFDSDDPEYYDPRRRTGPRSPKKPPKPTPSSTGASRNKRGLSTDVSGYITATNPYRDATRPTYQFYPVQGGALSMIKTIWRHDDEGVFSLWKGQTTHWIREMSHEMIQPTFEGYMNDFFGLYDDTIPLQHLDRAFPNFATMVGSHLITGWLLSPLDLIRTRMIAQTSHPQHRRYSNPIQALVDIISGEHRGSLWSLYFSSSLLLPTMIVYTVTPVLRHAAPLIIDRCVGISAADAPTRFALWELGLNTMGLAIIRPVETIRRRLQVQAYGGGRELETCVGVGRNYRGFWDCFYRIVTEEGGRRTPRPMPRHRSSPSSKDHEKPLSPVSWWDSWGIQGLYRGFMVDTALNIAHCLVRMTGSIPDELEEW
ncbi:mitochondrial carrier domain-containing protein [Syncephalis fuscata]|nr:mitochondrial carrier domain-containing protein [Syncephalis fuscata]